MHVLLSGASGFVGRHVLADLQSLGHKVTTLYRKPPSSPPKDGISYITVDMKPSTQWQDILKNIDVVIHTGDGLRVFEGLKTAPDIEKEHDAIETTMALARAAQQSGVRTFVYLSSIKAASTYCADHILNENDDPAPDRPFYGQLKAKIEKKLAVLSKNSDMHTVSLRSPIVYGVGGVGNFNRLITLADSPWPLPFAGLNNRRSIISVSNLSHALITAAQNPGKSSGIYFVHDEKPITMPDLISLLRQSLGRKRRLFAVPSFVIKSAMMLPIVKPVMLRLVGNLELSSKKFEKEFCWQAPVATQTALQDMIAHIKAQK